MRISVGLPTGVTALLFDEVAKRRRFENGAIEKLEAAGYSEVVLPILDYFEPYESLLTARRRDELYRFVDRDGELLALRGDFTPMLARLLALRLDSLELPLRLFHRGDLIRYQEERPGRLREYYQLGAELLGGRAEAADEEMMGLFVRLLAEPRSTRVRVVLGFAGALDQIFKQTSGDDPMVLARAVMRRERRAAANAADSLLEVVESGVPTDPGALGEGAAQMLERVLQLRDRMQQRFEEREIVLEVDLAEFARDFVDAELVSRSTRRPYYDGLVFRAYLEGGAQPVGVGGRYDRLFRRLGCDLPAVGFSINVDPLLRGASS